MFSLRPTRSCETDLENTAANERKPLRGESGSVNVFLPCRQVREGGK